MTTFWLTLAILFAAALAWLGYEAAVAPEMDDHDGWLDDEDDAW